MSASLGIDIGGTFTDLVVVDHATGRQASLKVLTSHDDPARAVAEGVRAVLAAAGLDAGAIGRVVHATTLFTNALIERQGARTGLITTAGFRDTLEIGRERKFELYDLRMRKPEPLVPRDLRLEVTERIRADGSVVTPLDADELRARARALVRRGVTSVAIVFLHAYAGPEHEAEAARLVAERYPALFVTASHEVAPEVREYERTSTAVANAYVKPLAHRYLRRMAGELQDLGVRAPLLLMLSSGGLTHVAEAERTPVAMLESGPAAGAIAAAFFGRADGGGDLLAFDMGGTTAKLSLVEGGEPLVAHAFEAARQKRFVEGSGLPVRISTVELIEIGAGGGSIARVDEIGLLRVGPLSAGSEPGPACYARGGTEPTVTDADLLLGYLDPEAFAGGTMRIETERARAALAPLAERVGLSLTETAWGIHDVVNENMAAAARVHVAERGRDPRAYALLATGGAGPVHACALGRKLGVREVICPPSAGVASALGLLLAPARVDRVATVGIRLDRDEPAALEAAFRRLQTEARAVIADTGLPLEAVTFQRLADGRFLGQGFDLTVALPPGPYDGGDAEATRRALTEAFEAAYREKFSLTPPRVPVEFIHVRLAARAPVAGAGVSPSGAAAGGLAPPLAGTAAGVVPAAAPEAGGGRRAASGAVGADDRAATATAGSGGPALLGRRPVYFRDARDYVETAVYDRSRLIAGERLEGPAVVQEAGSTLVVPPGASASVAPGGNLVVTLTAGG